jgi:hypothetical protein
MCAFHVSFIACIPLLPHHPPNSQEGSRPANWKHYCDMIGPILDQRIEDEKAKGQDRFRFLPQVLWLLVFGFLDIRKLVRLSVVSKSWKEESTAVVSFFQGPSSSTCVLQNRDFRTLNIVGKMTVQDGLEGMSKFFERRDFVRLNIRHLHINCLFWANKSFLVEEGGLAPRGLVAISAEASLLQSKFCQFISGLSRLRILHVQGLQHTGSVPDTLTDLYLDRFADIEGNTEILQIADGSFRLPQGLFRLPLLLRLAIRNFHITLQDLRRIRSPSLQSLDLTHSLRDTDDDDYDTDMDDAEEGAEGAMDEKKERPVRLPLAQTLADRFPELAVLDLSGCKLTPLTLACLQSTADFFGTLQLIIHTSGPKPQSLQAPPA